MSINLRTAAESAWLEVFKKVANAAVFLDETSAECLTWFGGLGRLYDNGALLVKEYSSFENGGSLEKAIFLVSSPLVGWSRTILRDIITNSSFNHCVLVSSCSPNVLTLATTGNVTENSQELTALHKLERDMLHWMKSNESVAEIFQFPISIIPVTDSLFVTPCFKNFFPCFFEDLQGKTLYSTVPRNLDLEALPLELQVGVYHITTTLNSLLSQLSARESIYTMGLLSSLVGSQLQKYSPSSLRIKTATNNVSLVIVDRTLDLCFALPLESTFDRLKATLPPFPGQCVDVAVQMKPISFCNFEANDGDITVAPGCLHEPLTDLMSVLIHKSVNEAISEVYMRLANVCETKSLKNPTVEDLKKLISLNFAMDYDRIKENAGVLQVALGLVESFESRKSSSLDMLEGIQKTLLFSIASESNTNEAMKQIANLISRRKDKDLGVYDLLSLLVFLYSLVGGLFSIDDYLENEVKLKLTDAIIEDNIDTIDSERVFKKLHSVKNAREHLEKYKMIARYESPVHPIERDSLLCQLVIDIVDVNRPDIPDLKYKANSALRDNFTSRFSGMILNTSKPHVMDNDNILFYFIGGVTADEVKFIQRCFKPYNKNVFVGATTCLSQSQLIDNLFTMDPLKPVQL